MRKIYRVCASWECLGGWLRSVAEFSFSRSYWLVIKGNLTAKPYLNVRFLTTNDLSCNQGETSVYQVKYFIISIRVLIAKHLVNCVKTMSKLC